MTTPPPESPSPISTPTVEETRALNNSASDEEIRALAQQLLKSGELGFDPTTILKGVVTEIAYNTAPPTVSIQISGDTTTTISSVRVLNNYAPVVNHTVLVAKQGADIVVLGHIADTTAESANGGDWIEADLAAGSHNGNANGTVAYRKVLDHGSWKMQWRGGWSVSGTTIVSSLSDEYRPSHRVSMLATRTSGGSISVNVVFDTDGSVTLVNSTTGTSNATASGDVGAASSSTGSAGGFSVGSHGHSIPFDGEGGVPTHNHFSPTGSAGGFSVGNHSHSNSHDHSFFGGSHSHPVSSPSWVSLNGLEYFL